jgi:hypothetical protein
MTMARRNVKWICGTCSSIALAMVLVWFAPPLELKLGASQVCNTIGTITAYDGSGGQVDQGSWYDQNFAPSWTFCVQSRLCQSYDRARAMCSANPSAATVTLDWYTSTDGASEHRVDTYSCGNIPNCSVTSNPAAFYEDINYSGQLFYWNTDMTFVGWDWNDRISSVSVPAGVTVVLYEHSDYGGQSLTLTSGTADLRDYAGPGADGTWNDAVSSLRVY